MSLSNLLKKLMSFTNKILISGGDQINSNSYISPKSSMQNDPNNHKSHERTIDLNQINTSSAKNEYFQSVSVEVEPSAVRHERVERSADPIISRTSDGDKYIMYKNIEEALDSNDVELSGRHVDISPSKTVSNKCIFFSPIFFSS